MSLVQDKKKFPHCENGHEKIIQKNS